MLEATGGVPTSWHAAAGGAGGAGRVGIALRSAVDALAAVPRALDPYRALDDAALLALTRLAADEVRLAQLHVSLLAGEIARRSAPELGHSGLAQSRGHRTPDELVRVTTGTRLTDARAAVRVGAAVADAGPLTDAVLDGRVSVAVADAIKTGLGVAAAGVDESALATAAGQLVDRVAGLDADRAAREARALRDELDAEGIQQREAVQRERRSLRIGRRSDGMGFAQWVLDPETFAIVSEVYDRITSPRRGGPSFAADSEPTDRVIDEQRTTEQFASDAFAELLRHGAAADTSQLLGDGPIGVRMLVAARTLTRRRGAAWFEGHPDAVSVATAERLACAAGTITITVDDDGQPLNLGRERRLFSRSQRIALAARDGGCRWPGCERPPSWCEAHHIDHWQRDGGRTDVADGILLCRHHHLLVHNNGWQISRAGPRYRLMESGRAGEPQHQPIDMPSRSRALADALSGAEPP
ncbi:HNH endonuclease signature motif containing protein [Microcella alkalica]